MKYRNNLLLGLFLLNSLLSFSQRIYFCKSYTNDGEPIKPSNYINVYSGTDSVQILFQTSGEKVKATRIFVTVDKLENNSYVTTDTKSFIPDKTKSWAKFTYLFTNNGNFRVSFLDENKKVLAKEFADVYVTTTATNTSATGSVDYYAKSSIVVATGVDNQEQPVNVSTKFNLPTQGSFTGTIYVKNDADIKPTQFSVIIKKMDNLDGTYKDYDTKYVDFNKKNSKIAYFNYSFSVAGKYMIFINTKEGAYVNTSYFELLTSDGKSVAGTVSQSSPQSSAGTIPSTMDYASSKVIFAENVDSYGYPIKESTTFYKQPNAGGSVTVLVQNTKAINTSQLVVFVDKLNPQGQYVVYDTKYYTINDPSAFKTWFKYNFYDVGQYRFKVQTKELVWVNDGYVTINSY